jgi:hypothetical protein
MPPALRLAAVALALLGSGCSWSWPRLVRTDPRRDLFDSGFPLVGAASTDAALCSLATAGPEATTLPGAPEPLDGAAPLGPWCAAGEPARTGQRGRVGRLVVVEGTSGRALGYLYPVPEARGLVVAFSGLGMSPTGWVNARFAELAARRGLATFAPVRDESARPIAFDPLREARRALGAALAVLDGCGLRERGLTFVGVSMGGLEALLANREAARQGVPARAAVLDPLLDPMAAAAHLDSFWHSAGTDGMQAYFHRILRGRYGEPESTTFRELLLRSAAGKETAEADLPRAWLCAADPATNAVFAAEGDPVLGDAQSEFVRSCGFPVRPARAKGHVGLACRLELFDELLDAAGAGVGPPRAVPAS